MRLLAQKNKKFSVLSNITIQKVSYFTFVMCTCLLSGCFLEHFTHPDDKARLEIAKYENVKMPCAAKAGVCYSKYTSKSKRFSFNDQYYLQKLESENDALRTQAVNEIAEIGVTDPRVVSKIDYLAIHDSSKWVRRASVKALAKIQGQDAIPTLSKAEKDKDPWVRHSASLAKSKLK